MSTRHVVYMGLSDLAPAERNPRNHDLPSLVASLRRYGWTNPALVDERTGRMVAGHGRREACVMIRQTGEPPPGGVHVDDDGEWLVPVLRGWQSRDDTEAEAYIIADNRLSEAGGWIERDLALMLEDVVTDDAGLMETLGFTADALDDMLSKIDPETLGPVEDGHHAGEAGEDLTIGGHDTPDTTASDADETTDLSAATKTKTHACPSCGYEWEDR